MGLNGSDFLLKVFRINKLNKMRKKMNGNGVGFKKKMNSNRGEKKKKK